MIIASSSEVYGKSRSMPFAEEDDLVLGSTANLRWSYACAKALDECLALSYAQEKKLSAIIVRLFNTTGPRQTGHYGMVLPGFVSQALKGEPITVYGSGTQTRCFAHVADVVESLVRLMSTPSALGEIFNVGNDEEITIEDLAAKVKQAAGSSSDHPQGPVQRGLRRRIRGHGAPRARRAQARALHRLSAADSARPDHRGHRRRAARGAATLVSSAPESMPGTPAVGAAGDSAPAIESAGVAARVAMAVVGESRAAAGHRARRRARLDRREELGRRALRRGRRRER